jgi:hypothetical protein
VRSYDPRKLTCGKRSLRARLQAGVGARFAGARHCHGFALVLREAQRIGE